MFAVRHPFLRATTLFVAATTACEVVDPASVNPTVAFKTDAPLCSSRMPVQLQIDRVQVGVDTFTVNLAPNHTTSRPFATRPGTHTLSARIVNGFVWSDTTVKLTDSQAFTWTLPLSCS